MEEKRKNFQGNILTEYQADQNESRKCNIKKAKINNSQIYLSSNDNIYHENHEMRQR